MFFYILLGEPAMPVVNIVTEKGFALCLLCFIFIDIHVLICDQQLFQHHHQ